MYIWDFSDLVQFLKIKIIFNLLLIKSTDLRFYKEAGNLYFADFLHAASNAQAT